MAGLSTNLDLYMRIRSNGELWNANSLCEFLVSLIPSELSQEDFSKIKEFCRRFINDLKKRWAEANRTEKTFMNRINNQEWLEKPISWPVCETIYLSSVMGIGENTIPESVSLLQVEVVSFASTSDVGTTTEKVTRKPFEDLSNKQKRRRSSSMVEDSSEEELQYFYLSKLKANGKLTLAKIVEHLAKHPEVIGDVHSLLFEKKEKQVAISDDKSLALYTSLALSKWQYLTLRSLLKEESSAILPSYQKLLIAKKRCYPPETSLQVSENGARIRLQDLLDHTIQRIVLDLVPITSSQHGSLKMVWKWGLDGSSSQSNYKQRSSDPEFSDSSVVMTSIVPLRLVNGENSDVWECPNPNSTNYCRPVQFTFATETAAFVITAITDMEQQISELQPSRIGDLEIVHELHMTMIDGKVANIVAEVGSNATCPICLAKPSHMNKLELLASKPLRDEIYKYGLSSLHMKIRCMECILHVSYNMDFERWSARGADKSLKEAKKASTQQQFREQTGMLIDTVKQGFGTTNDGNTARRFFNDYKKSSRITGVDENLIFKFAVILQVISSGNKINIDNFRSFCKETAELFVNLYPWYYMPVSVHKLLIHGADICNHFSALPIGIMSEEASEARNKDFRHVREKSSRKIGRLQTNEDILHGLLISSDPHISLIKPKYTKKSHQQLFPESVQLLQMESLEKETLEEGPEEDTELQSENTADPLM